MTYRHIISNTHSGTAARRVILAAALVAAVGAGLAAHRATDAQQSCRRAATSTSAMAGALDDMADALVALREDITGASRSILRPAAGTF